MRKRQGVSVRNAVPETKTKKEESMYETQQEIYDKIALNIQEVNRKDILIFPDEKLSNF